MLLIKGSSTERVKWLKKWCQIQKLGSMHYDQLEIIIQQKTIQTKS